MKLLRGNAGGRGAVVLVHVIKLIHNPELSPFPPLPSPPLSVCARACDPQQFAHPAERLHQEKHSFMGACKLDETRGAGAHLLLGADGVLHALGAVALGNAARVVVAVACAKCYIIALMKHCRRTLAAVKEGRVPVKRHWSSALEQCLNHRPQLQPPHKPQAPHART